MGHNFTCFTSFMRRKTNLWPWNGPSHNSIAFLRRKTMPWP
jgi:hypothetical protein